MVGRFGASVEWREGQWSPQQQLLASVWKFSEPLLPQLNGRHAAPCLAVLPDPSQPCRLQAHLFSEPLGLPCPSIHSLLPSMWLAVISPYPFPHFIPEKGLFVFMGKLG